MRCSAAYLFRGPVLGPLTHLEADVTYSYEPGGGYAFGKAVAGPGDVDGDGLPDLLVGDEEYEDEDDSLGEDGAAYLFLSPPVQVADASAADARIRGDYDVLLGGDSHVSAVGTALAGGDLTGDGRPDLAIGWASRVALVESPIVGSHYIRDVAFAEYFIEYDGVARG
jgi:hypothetical protein